MSMSKSRLEKFLYALYSLDSSDLPTPLSRIEEIYNCWVTGEEAPTFEPLSRVEKYLMAILGAYDVDSLPNPLSRVEVLLHKLATGDDNLDDVKSFLSEHEELLAEIIRNGGVGENIDIEYVLYSLSTDFNTLYNTAEKPVKSAILKGQTLVNLLPNKGEQHVSVDGNRIVEYPLLHTLKKNTKYLIYYNIEDISNPSGSGSLQIYIYSKDLSAVDYIDSIDKIGLRKHIFTTSDKDFEQPNVWFFVFINETTEVIFDEVMILEYQDGMENWDIPYFEGMKSVKMPVLTTTGKNLFDVETSKKGLYWSTSETQYTDSEEDSYLSEKYIPVMEGDILIANNLAGSVQYMEYDSNKNFIQRSLGIYYTPYTVPKGVSFLRVSFYRAGVGSNCQIERGTKSTPFEPYKSNILTVNEDVTLRGIGNVEDELNLMTGEVTERIGEIVLDGSDDEQLVLYSSQKLIYQGILYSDKYISNRQLKKIYYNKIDRFCIEVPDTITSISEARQWLSENNVIIQFPLTEESIKTVDLSVVDQDGNDTELSTFNDITHVTLSSEGLIPEAELEVATKNEEVLNTMSLEMDDISTTQNALQETSSTQSENVDATMMATTEIYEQLL